MEELLDLGCGAAWLMVCGEGPAGRAVGHEAGCAARSRFKPYLRFCGTRITAEDFGNIHYGYVGRAAGFPLTVLKVASRGVNRGRLDANERHDQAMLTWGYRLMGAWGKRYNMPWRCNEYIRYNY